MLTEYVIAHRATQHWSSITLHANDGHAEVYQDGNLYSMSRDNAMLTLDYCRQSSDYIVEEITAPLGGYRAD